MANRRTPLSRDSQPAKPSEHPQTESSRAEKRPFRFSLPVRVVAIVCAVVLILSGLLLASGSVYISSMLGLISYDEGNVDYSNLPMLPGDIDDGSVDKVIENPVPVNIEHIEVRGTQYYSAE